MLWSLIPGVVDQSFACSNASQYTGAFRNRPGAVRLAALIEARVRPRLCARVTSAPSSTNVLSCPYMEIQGARRRPQGSPRGSAVPLPIAVRPEPDVRRRLSAPALRTFFNIAGVWQLTVQEQRALLGWPAASTFHKYKAG